MSKAKRPLPPEERADNDRLKAIWNSKKAELRLNQELLADAMDVGQSAVSHYLNGYNRLNAKAAARFAEVLKVKVSDFSPSLALEIERMAQTGLSVVDDEDRRPTPPPENHTQLGAEIDAIMAKATPRSRLALEHIAAAAGNGELSEDDLIMLEQIAKRFQSPGKKPDRSGDKIKDLMQGE
jgi:transcriptional regulator with XRE-family HTH domain